MTLDPPTITLHRTTAIWSTVAVLILWIASIGWAVDAAQETAATDACIQALESAERTAAVLARSQETYEATVGAWLEAMSESGFEDLREVDR